jgi:glycosyltransferase involved in cell wall biosynthesis
VDDRYTAAQVGPVEASVILPCRNEESSIEPMIHGISTAFSQFRGRLVPRLVFVDDGSTDQTWATIERNCGDFGAYRVTGIRLGEMLGKGHAQAVGLEAARPFEGPIVFMDADGQHDPRYLQEAVSSCVQSHRAHIARRSSYRRRWAREVGSIGLRALAFLAGSPFRPDLGEFLVIPPDVARSLAASRDLGSVPLVPLVQAIDPQYTTFEVQIAQRFDGTLSTRWSAEALWQKAVLHLLVNPWRLMLRLSALVFAAVALLGIYGVYVGLSSLSRGAFLGTGSVIVILVFVFATLATLQIVVLAFLVLLLRRMGDGRWKGRELC